MLRESRNMKQLIVVCLCFSIAIINPACHKSKATPKEPIDLTPKIPEATNIGANTFGCYINGALFVAATNNPNSVLAVSCSYNSISPNELRIQGSRRNDSINDNISFRSYVLDPNKNYNMDVIGAQRGYANYFLFNTDCFEYDHMESNLGSVYISHLDTINRIVSGTFEMELFNEDCIPNLLKITEGRFDLTY